MQLFSSYCTYFLYTQLETSRCVVRTDSVSSVQRSGYCVLVRHEVVFMSLGVSATSGQPSQITTQYA